MQYSLWGYLLMISVIVLVAIFNYRHLVVETNDDVPELLAPVVSLATDPVWFTESALKIGLLDSSATRAFSRSVRSDYSGLLANWKEFLSSQSLAVTLFRDTEDAKRFDLIVLAETICLSDKETADIKNYLVNGGNVLMVGAVGSRDENGQWANDHLFCDVAGMRFAGNANLTPPSRVTLALNMNSPFAPNWTPRSNISLQSFNPILVGRLVEKRAHIVATVPYPDPQDANILIPMPTLCYGNYLRGRFVWAGFSPDFSRPDAPSTSHEAIQELFGNIVGWLSGAPKVRTEIWPDDKKISVSPVVYLQNPASEEWAQMVRSGLPRYPITLAIAWDVLDGYQQRIKDLGKHVDLVIAVDNNYVAQNNLQGRQMNLAALADKMRSISGRESVGLLLQGIPPHEVAAEALAAGYQFILSEPVGDIQDYPEILMSRRTQGWLKQPTRIMLAPYHASWLAGISRGRSATILFDPLRQEEAMSEFVRWMESHRTDVWDATVSEVCQWRGARNAVAMTRQFLSGGRLRVRLTNGSYQDMQDFAFSVEFPTAVRDVDMWAKAIGMELPVKSADENKRVWHFVVQNIQPGKTVEYVITPLQ
jgi:hypothetical protein